MNTGAVSQPIAAGEATADRSRNAGRKGGSDGEGSGGFSGLLSKLASNREQEDHQTVPAKEAPLDGSDISRVLDWLRSSVEAAAGDGHAPDPEQESPQPDSGGGGLTDIDVNALMQVLNGNAAPAGANGLAAMAGRVANGTATKAETALMQAAVTAREGEALSPEQLIFASLAKAAVRTEEPASDEAKPTPVTLTVVRRETHLAPVVDAGVEWAARLAAEGRLLRTGAQRDTASSGDVQGLQAENGTQPSGEAQLVDPQRAVTPVRDGQLGNDWRRGSAPMAEPQVTPDVPTASGDGAAPIARSDALINTSSAGGAVAQQIADRVASEAGTLTAQAGRPDAPTFAVKREAAVKVLHLQLQPEGLGTVTIRMSVKDQALRLDLEVGRGETAQMIQRDRETLSTLLRSAGYMIDGVDVRVADVSGAGAQSGNGQVNTPMHGGGQSGSSQAEGRSPGERSQDGRPQNERGNNAFGKGRNGEDEQARNTARSSGVYI